MMSFDDIECLLYIVTACLWCKHDINDCQNVLCVEHDTCMKACSNSNCEYVMHVNGKVMTLDMLIGCWAMAYLYEYDSLLIPAEFLANALCAKSGSMSTPDRWYMR